MLRAVQVHLCHKPHSPSSASRARYPLQRCVLAPIGGRCLHPSITSDKVWPGRMAALRPAGLALGAPRHARPQLPLAIKCPSRAQLPRFTGPCVLPVSTPALLSGSSCLAARPCRRGAPCRAAEPEATPQPPAGEGLVGEDAAAFDLSKQSLQSWAIFSALLSVVLAALYLVGAGLPGFSILVGAAWRGSPGSMGHAPCTWKVQDEHGCTAQAAVLLGRGFDASRQKGVNQQFGGS